MKALVIANGSIDDYSYYRNKIAEHDYVICADGAIRHCIETDITPDLWVGDFDSCEHERYCSRFPHLYKVETHILSPEKDETDTHIACNIAIEKGYKNITIWGACGSRIDHMLSNIHLLEMLMQRNVEAVIENEKNTIQIFNDSLVFKKSRKYLSLIPLDKTVVVKKTNGLLYNLENYPLSRQISMGVSNEITENEAIVLIEKGTMLAIQSDD